MSKLTTDYSGPLEVKDIWKEIMLDFRDTFDVMKNKYGNLYFNKEVRPETMEKWFKKLKDKLK